MVLARYGDSTASEDAKLLGESIQMPFSGRVAKSRFLKGAMSERMASWDHKIYPSEASPLTTLWACMRGIPSWPPGSGFGESQPCRSSDIQLADRMGMSFGKPTPLDKSGIREIVNQFAYTAEAAYRTGFDGVQLHGAHGYLIAQFLSQTTNNRTDEYGGSIETYRSRIIKEITEAIRVKVPDRKFVIGIKVNSVEFQAKGFQPEEAAELCKQLEAMEIDFIELSGGTYEEFGFKHSDTGIKYSLGTELVCPTNYSTTSQTVVYVTGGFRSTSAMAEAVRLGTCAGVGLGRPAGSDPLLPNDIIQRNVTGATDMKIPPHEFGLGLLATGVQMEAIARGKPVIDLSDPRSLPVLQRPRKVTTSKKRRI
ncbi:NADH:flavin oxidoreductase / NADH oxidase family [Rhizoctonia solani]|uniref:NADH:flavin oxidoreductase / NADH oxidase family n=1 Tax=Rhizoctonia solani TaxID=456999 RepID=A0A8H7I8H2_9AGAM|nr:NADH:flavin oxidoreductase / NADH oxidase family [Rhizoctonia solani]